MAGSKVGRIYSDNTYNPYSAESQQILDKIREYRSDLAKAEDLLRQGKLGAVNELLDAEFFHFCRILREQAFTPPPDPYNKKAMQAKAQFDALRAAKQRCIK